MKHVAEALRRAGKARYPPLRRRDRQVHLAVRLALAEVLAGDDRRFLVLDDILTATDTGRLARVLTILEEAAQRLQLFILTCHPERYRGLSGAEFYDLEELLSRS